MVSGWLHNYNIDMILLNRNVESLVILQRADWVIHWFWLEACRCIVSINMHLHQYTVYIVSQSSSVGAQVTLSWSRCVSWAQTPWEQLFFFTPYVTVLCWRMSGNVQIETRTMVPFSGIIFERLYISAVFRVINFFSIQI